MPTKPATDGQHGEDDERNGHRPAATRGCGARLRVARGTRRRRSGRRGGTCRTPSGRRRDEAQAVEDR
ncbi:MAG: hypothetical protein MZV70_66610 [Desulfobacterales bacterium]|nr:hypothetical protein [Desulfobacterales bacterium]